MKRILICILCTALILTTAGCKLTKNSISTTTSETQSTGLIENTTAPTGGDIVQRPMVAVCVPVITESEKTQDGTTIFNYAYQNISLTVPDPEVADKVIVDFLNRVDQTADQAESIRTAAINDYQSSDSWSPYLCQIIYEPIRVDHNVLTFFGSFASYSGSSHPETVHQSVNYDLVTGEVLTLSDIITPETDTNTLYQKIIDILNAQSRMNLYQGFENTVKERFSHGFAADQAWYLSPTGLCFYFSPYEIAPYASGVVTADIPYHQLAGILNDAYFPAEQEAATGAVLAQKYESDKLEDYSQFAEAIINDEGGMILLHTDKSVYDIRLGAHTQASDDNTIYTVFAACGLTPADAIIIQAANNSSLLLTYRTQENTIHKYKLSNDTDANGPVLTIS